MFEKTLTDIVKGIRASKRDTGLYISQCLSEIKAELASQDMYTKANALQKLTFLQMMGYSMSIASFCTIEVMSSAKFAHKRIGYLAAIQGFNSKTDVILLTTNLLQKELRAAATAQRNNNNNSMMLMKGVYEAGLAINCISNIVTPDLARDLLPELSALLQHPQPLLRKKAILCLFKVFLRYPQGLRLTFSKLQTCLDDTDAAVVSSAVNVITELSITNPKNYLPLAPAFFQLVSTSSNNWMLIKVVKLLGSLVPEEPRLARKLLEPLAGIVRKTQAKSLLFEGCYTITLCLPYCRKSDGSMPANAPEIIQLCAETLYSFVQESDQNLKYLGLVGFGSLLQSQPRVFFSESTIGSSNNNANTSSSNGNTKNYRGLILPCLSDPDVTIRSRALSLLPGLASRKNWHELIGQLVPHVIYARGTYKQELCVAIIQVCKSEKYSLVSNFEWYLDAVLLELAQMRGLERQAEFLQQQILDVVLRVLPLRTYAVRRCITLLLLRVDEQQQQRLADSKTAASTTTTTTTRKQLFPQVLGSMGWIIGEYSDLIREANKDDDDVVIMGGGGPEMEFYFDDSSKGTYHAILQALLLPTNINLPHPTQAAFVQASLKVLAAACTTEAAATDAELEACINLLLKRLPLFAESSSVDVVDRAFRGLQLLESLGLNTASSSMVTPAAGDLLNLGGGGAHSKPAVAQSSSSLSIAAKARQASSTLNNLLKPAPMKPSGAKAQRKKNEALDVSVNLSVFDDLVDEEVEYREQNSISLGSVSFTQQKLARVEVASRIMEGISSDSAGPTSSSAALSAGTFQNSMYSSQQPNPATTTTRANGESRKGDPFYLDSRPSGDTEESGTKTSFGMIQLSSDDGDDNNGGRRRKKKSKKTKKSKANTSTSAADPFAAFTDVSSPIAAAGPVGIYHSDDDDSDDAAMSNNKKKNGRGANGLSRIDLTAPMDHAGILPDRTHHKVSERPNIDQSSQQNAKPKKSKKSKKDKKNKADSSMGDLLDMTIGATGSNQLDATTPSLAPSLSNTTTSVNPINSAFDDLLDLATVTPTTTQSGPSDSAVFATRTSHPGRKQFWLKATVKATEWSSISVTYQVVLASSNGNQHTVQALFRVQNSSSTPIEGVVLNLGELGHVSVGSVLPGGSTEAKKTEPFPFPGSSQSCELKGTIEYSMGSSTVKVWLPVSLLLQPDNISLEQLGEELSAGAWYSHSSKVSLQPGTSFQAAKADLLSFLNASEVPGVSGDAATFAGRSIAGTKVRIMVKIKKNTAKIDVKSTDDTLARSIASDVKRLQLI